MVSPNIILIVIDTLRKDYAKYLEIELKKLGFISYEQTIAPAPWTLPSHSSIFSGAYPLVHGSHETKSKKFFDIRFNYMDNLLTYLNETDYNTISLTANVFITPFFGFRGFNKVFYAPHNPFINLMVNLNRVTKNIKEVSSTTTQGKIYILKKLLLKGRIDLIFKYGLYRTLVSDPLYLTLQKIYSKFRKWPLDKGISYFTKKLISKENILMEPFFLFVNLMEVHEPYFVSDHKFRNFKHNIPPNKPDYNYLQKARIQYEKEVRYVTSNLVRIFNSLQQKKLFNESLIIVTSDHGQLLGEHDKFGHGTFLYDELLRVPLLIKYPKGYEIEHVQNESGYISLVKLKSFILSIIDNELSNDGILYSDTVFAESYGVHQKVGELKSEEERINIEQLEKYRIAVYYKNFKGIFNVTDWKFEKITSYAPSVEVTEDIVKYMKKEVIKFLKTATLAKVPKIKL